MASVPITRSLWPAIHLVAECSTTSAPCSSGRMPNGVARVASTTVRTPCCRAAAASAGRSGTTSIGLVGSSSQSIAACGSASIAAAVSVTSTVRSDSRPSSTWVSSRVRLKL